MNLNQFRYVLVLADRCSFSKAADELNISQPYLSQYIKRIENDLGVVLFDRSNGDVRLTDAGRVYIDAGKKMIDIERQMQNQFNDISSNNAGSIVVGIAPTRCQYLMPEIVRRFHKEYPGMHIIVEERFLGTILEDAEKGAFDLCVATLPVDKNKFSYELMMKEEVILAVPKILPSFKDLSSKTEIIEDRLYPALDINSIAGASYVCLSDSQPTQKLMNDFQKEYDFSVRTAVKCMSIETQYSMVKSGIGLALIPSSVAKYSADDSIAYFSVKQSTPRRDMAVIYRKGQYLSKAVIALKNIMTSI